MDVLVADLGKDRERMQTEIDLIIEQVYRIRTITDQLLQYSRSVQDKHGDPAASSEVSHFALAEPIGQGRPAPNPVSHGGPSALPAELVDEALKLLSHELAGRDINVVVCKNKTRRVLIDRQEFLQIMINLISNAIQAIEHSGEISVTTTDDEGKLVSICVSDSGRGISAEHLPKVFDPFFTAGKAQGTGLGLSVSYGIARRHGGDISVDSEMGTGSRFTLTLPAA